MTENTSIKFINEADSDPRDILLLHMNQDEILELQNMARPLMVTAPTATDINMESSVEEKLESFKL